MSVYSVIFCGTPEFAVPSLVALTGDPRFRITQVYTQPDKPVGRKQVLTSPPVKVAARALKLPVLQPKNINQDFPFSIYHPDFLIIVAYGQILSQKMLDVPTVAPVNIHASLLPRLRGASPIQHAILQNFSETGVTIQRMQRALDSGPILAQRTVSIDARETSQTLNDKLSTVGADLLLHTLTQPLVETAQDDVQATFCGKLTRADSIVDPQTMTAQEIDRRVRALVPWPGVTWNTAKIIAAALQPDPQAMALDCAGGTVLYITKIQPASGKPMTGAEFMRGRKSIRL